MTRMKVSGARGLTVVKIYSSGTFFWQNSLQRNEKLFVVIIKIELFLREKGNLLLKRESTKDKNKFKFFQNNFWPKFHLHMKWNFFNKNSSPTFVFQKFNHIVLKNVGNLNMNFLFYISVLNKEISCFIFDEPETFFSKIMFNISIISSNDWIIVHEIFIRYGDYGSSNNNRLPEQRKKRIPLVEKVIQEE